LAASAAYWLLVFIATTVVGLLLRIFFESIPCMLVFGALITACVGVYSLRTIKHLKK